MSFVITFVIFHYTASVAVELRVFVMNELRHNAPPSRSLQKASEVSPFMHQLPFTMKTSMSSYTYEHAFVFFPRNSSKWTEWNWNWNVLSVKSCGNHRCRLSQFVGSKQTSNCREFNLPVISALIGMTIRCSISLANYWKQMSNLMCNCIVSEQFTPNALESEFAWRRIALEFRL